MLTFYGHFSGCGSYPIVCRALREALDKEPVQFVDIRQWGAREPIEDPTGPALLFGFPSWWQDIGPRHSIRIGYHVCDVLPAPPDWVEVLNGLDYLVTPSAWCQAVFLASGVTTPILVVPHGVNPVKPVERKTQTPHRLLHLCSSPRPDRKNTIALADAFASLKEDAALDVMTESLVVKQHVAKLEDPRIQVVPEQWVETQEESCRRFQQYDFVVQPSRAEGFGMIPMEALASGVPIIATTCTGHMDSLRWHGTETPPGFEPVSSGVLRPCSGGLAPEVGVDDIREALSWALSTGDGCQQEAREVAPSFAELHAWPVQLSSLFDLLDTVLF